MTRLDLRIKYKADTGFAPTYGRFFKGDDDQLQLFPYMNVESCNYRGGMTHEYAEWLEEYRGPNSTPMNMTWQRMSFFKETGLHATYYDKKGILRYTRLYKEWLEDLLCKVFDIWNSWCMN